MTRKKTKQASIPSPIPVAKRLPFNPHRPNKFYCTGCHNPIAADAMVCTSCGSYSQPNIVVQVGRHVYELAKPPRPNDISIKIAIDNHHTEYMYLPDGRLGLLTTKIPSDEHIKEMVIAALAIETYFIEDNKVLRDTVLKSVAVAA